MQVDKEAVGIFIAGVLAAMVVYGLIASMIALLIFSQSTEGRWSGVVGLGAMGIVFGPNMISGLIAAKPEGKE